MLNLVKELKLNEKLMKRILKDKENGLRDVTLSVIHTAIVESSWFKETYDTNGLNDEERYQIIKKQDEVLTEKFSKEVFEQLAK